MYYHHPDPYHASEGQAYNAYRYRKKHDWFSFGVCKLLPPFMTWISISTATFYLNEIDNEVFAFVLLSDGINLLKDQEIIHSHLSIRVF